MPPLQFLLQFLTLKTSFELEFLNGATDKNLEWAAVFFYK